MKKVMIATPSGDGTVTVPYLHSLTQSILFSAQHDVALIPQYRCYDSLVQRARNDLVEDFIKSDCDEIVFIDADQGWDPVDLLKLIESEYAVIGAAVPNKSDMMGYNVKRVDISDLKGDEPLIQVESVGTGFLKVSREALQAVHSKSVQYEQARNVFEIRVVNGSLHSEDVVFCQKLRDNVYNIHVDTTININHTGVKTWKGDFQNFLKLVIQTKDVA